MPNSPPPVSLAGARLKRGRPQLGRSFRLHRPRGAFCHGGWCQQCLVELADGRRLLACQTPAVGELRKESAVRRLIGRLAEPLPPWFYERRLLWPAFMRQPYLNILRRLSAAPRLDGAMPRPTGSWTRTACHTLVVGGGLAGMRSALRLAGAGRQVILIEAEEFGGRARFIPSLASDIARSVDALSERRVSMLSGTICLGLYADPREALCLGTSGPLRIGFSQLVVATGAYDRLLPFANNDLPGILGLRAFERLAAQGGLPSDAVIGVYATAVGVAQAAAAAGAAGHRPAWVASLDELAADGHHGSTSITAADGKRRIRSVTLSDGRRLPCNLLVLGYAQPTYELQMQAGLHATLEGEPPAIVPGGDAAFPLLAVGEAAGADGPRSAAAQAEEATAAWLAMAPQPPARGRSLAPTRFPVAPDAFVCLCEDVRVRDVQQAIADGFSDVDLVKRRTGAGTGPCQGKLCHAEIARCLRDNARVAALPTVRPLLRPTTLARLAGGGDG